MRSRMHYSILWLLLALFLSCSKSSSSPRTLKLCLYLRAIRRSTSECDRITLDNSTVVEETENSANTSTLSPLAKIIANIEKRNEKQRLIKKFKKLTVSLPTCSASLDDGYKQCRMDITCTSGYSCENKSKKRCCMEANHTPTIERPTEEFKTCPSSQQMAYFCQSTKAKKVMKSCKSDVDCMFSNVQKCCDAGCGFNVCVVASGNFTQNTLIFLGSK